MTVVSASANHPIADIRRSAQNARMDVRFERPGEEETITRLITAAFLEAEHRDGSEADVVERLRTANALTISLVAATEAGLIGHVAFSPVTVDGRENGWFGLGPVAVLPAHQGRGVGTRLIEEGMAQLRDLGAKGCVVLGEPALYSRFGFASTPDVWLANVPPQYFCAVRLADGDESGEVKYHPAFGIA